MDFDLESIRICYCFQRWKMQMLSVDFWYERRKNAKRQKTGDGLSVLCLLSKIDSEQEDIMCCHVGVRCFIIEKSPVYLKCFKYFVELHWWCGEVTYTGTTCSMIYKTIMYYNALGLLV